MNDELTTASLEMGEQKRSRLNMGLQKPVEIMLTDEWNVNLDRPSEEEIRYEIAALKREKAPIPDGLYPALFKEGGKSLVNHLTNLIDAIWDEEKVPAEWDMSTDIPIFKKNTPTLCDNHRGISLLAVTSKVLSGPEMGQING
ncbi:hypothetical protein T265_05743 [Opisthorchis viverrini]|uniref:Uncharacterized protein n=1 Tax=Opisthorchis viverrini TaxID=6198 RepID=A0A074ZUR3_OPIVI|nr:hypothetical protein T265_05743 [Opisthorchis viverrini]KER27120.1 hypothetical protein T265_05743 [Opisthorchis viverrini]